MSNIFTERSNYRPQVKRNTFDLSFQNNLTMRFGRLTPVMVKEVLPGDTFNISATAVMNAFPTKFPVQTPCRMHMHFFLCRNRNVWSGFQDYITGVKDLTPPWIHCSFERAKRMFASGSLMDYLGVPTTIGGNYTKTTKITFPRVAIGNRTFHSLPWLLNTQVIDSSTPTMDDTFYFLKVRDLIKDKSVLALALDKVAGIKTASDLNNGNFDFKPFSPNHKPSVWTKISEIIPVGSEISNKLNFDGTVLPYGSSPEASYFNIYFTDENYNTVYVCNENEVITTLQQPWVVTLTPSMVSTINQLLSEHSLRLGVITSFASTSGTKQDTVNVFNNNLMAAPINNVLNYNKINNLRWFDSVLSPLDIKDSSVDIVDLDVTKCPFAGDNPQIRIPAYLPLHYEQIYNSFYREKNQPYMLNGEQQFNQFIPDVPYTGGAIDYEFDFHNRNWERDYFTSCVTSPQFGEAPLVGLTVNGDGTATMIFQQEDGSTGTADINNIHSNVKNFALRATLDADGHTIVGIQSYDKELPQSNLQRLMEGITYGISINDFRNVNAFQRFKENMLRVKSLRYRDQMRAHFGVNVTEVAVDTPTFEGGFSFDVNGFEVQNTAASTESPLGDIGGRLKVSDKSKHSVNIYADEHGYIICLACITPLPVYSSVLPYHFLHSGTHLTYFTPEMKNIGYQPVTYKEIAPLQRSIESGNVNDTFGYQNAWSAYVASIDEVHGNFRTNQRDFVLNRTFNTSPVIGDDFLLVDDTQLNDVFESQEQDDKFMGSIYFKITAHRQVPRYGIATLE